MGTAARSGFERDWGVLLKAPQPALRARQDSVGGMQFNAFAAYSATVGLAAEVIPEVQNSDYESGIVQFGEVLAYPDCA